MNIKAWVKDLASTNWMIFTGTAAGLCTTVVYSIAVLARITIQLDAWIAWLGFLAGWIGFGVRQFKHKRDTYLPGGSNAKVEQSEQQSSANV